MLITDKICFDFFFFFIMCLPGGSLVNDESAKVQWSQMKMIVT